MTKSIDVIKNRIIAEAMSFENEVCAKAEAEAKKILDDYTKKAESIKASCEQRSKELYEKTVSGAHSSVQTMRRNALLEAKVAIIETAFKEAQNKILALDKDEYLKIFTGYLRKALVEYLPDGESATLAVGKSSPVSARELIDHTDGINGILCRVQDACDETVVGGFCLVYGDVKIDCSVKTVVASLPDDVQSKIASVLFEDSVSETTI